MRKLFNTVWLNTHVHCVWCFCILLFSCPLFAGEKDLSTIYHSLHPTSIREHLAFHSLYPATKEGEKAKIRAFALMTKHAPKAVSFTENFELPAISLSHLLSLTHLFPEERSVQIHAREISLLNQLCSFFPNRLLKGHSITDAGELDSLSSDEIDLARALLLLEYDGREDKHIKIAEYEAMLDFMTLEILAKLPQNASPIEKVKAINEYIFHELQFRFPPHSLWAKDIDEYTLLPAVMDSHLGVCLGVSILYLSLSQRIDLSLEIVTPPGHIYVRLRDGNTLTVIETTARGIALPEDTYLSVNTKSLKTRTMKEVVGLAFFNQASVFWKKGSYEKANDRYAIAERFVQSDPLINELKGYIELILGKKAEGEAHLRAAEKSPPDYELFHGSAIQDYFAGNLDIEGISLLFEEVDHTRSSIETKRDKLRALLTKYPQSKEATFHLALSYLQLGRSKEASDLLKRYTALEQRNPTVYYYLSILCIQRYNYTEAWQHLNTCKALCQKGNHTPKALISLENELRRLLPSPQSSQIF